MLHFKLRHLSQAREAEAEHRLVRDALPGPIHHTAILPEEPVSLHDEGLRVPRQRLGPRVGQQVAPRALGPSHTVVDSE
jgi:hypothetical protein